MWDGKYCRCSGCGEIYNRSMEECPCCGAKCISLEQDVLKDAASKTCTPKKYNGSGTSTLHNPEPAVLVKGSESTVPASDSSSDAKNEWGLVELGRPRLRLLKKAFQKRYKDVRSTSIYTAIRKLFRNYDELIARAETERILANRLHQDVNEKSHKLVYTYPKDGGRAAFPRNAEEICKQLGSGLAMHQTTSMFLILSLIGCLGYFIIPGIGVAFGIAPIIMVVLKIVVLQRMAVHLKYSIDQNWENFANTRMAPFTYMVKCQRVWEVLSSQGGYDPKYNAGSSFLIFRKDVRVVNSLPFPFRTNVNGYAIYLQDRKFVFLPDCVYMIQEAKVTALHYEDIKWQIGTTSFVESQVPSDARVIGNTWQYVNKDGSRDRRFSYNPRLWKCLYGEFEVNFANKRRAKFLLSGIKMVERMMSL